MICEILGKHNENKNVGLLYPLSLFHCWGRMEVFVVSAGSARIGGQKSEKEGELQIKVRMQVAAIKGNKSESALAIQQPKLVSIFLQFRYKTVSTSFSLKALIMMMIHIYKVQVRCMFCRFAKPEKSLKVTRQLSGNLVLQVDIYRCRSMLLFSEKTKLHEKLFCNAKMVTLIF